MKIEDNRIDNETSFEDLFIGDCFTHNDEYYIKIDVTCSSPNAFNLERNETDTFNNGNVIVTSVKAKVVIE